MTAGMTDAGTTGAGTKARPAAYRRGTALMAFGGVGLLLLGACLIAVVLSLVPLVNGAAALEQQRTDAVALIGPAADALEATATTAEHAGASLGTSVAAARDAASVTGQLADALQGLAAFSSAFGDTAARSRTLSEDLSTTANALAQNQLDSASTAAQLRTLADRLHDLGETLGTAASPPPSAVAGVAVPLALGLVILLLLWLAVIAGACIWLGRRMRAGTVGADIPG
jgi:hypothetical protein